ncbi:aldehyde dehydrogenase family protein [Aliidiomarina sedimenti]|uniref:Aldehyde dehydrogenase n=1 Tax=Aliidiomarina sedimenti TaxID=1933879 RepID=A0ABY0BXL2_9GAMM|nr:aldehyde dehydrogenase family protein [Aliidiomarina sedimenti]RUO29018.1 aldehyde dehydrogenase family protein [Aliidiomarina sedimenti]
MTAIEQLRATFSRGVTRSMDWRFSQLEGIERFLTEQTDVLSAALKADLGKSNAEAWTTEIGFTLKDVQYTRKHLRKWLKPRRVSTPLVARPGHSKITLEPLGVVLIFGAWNYPLQLSLSPLIAALAAGNCALLKPSEVSPATSKVLADVLPGYLDSNAVEVLEGDADVATELLKQRFDHIFYTGGGTVGKIVMRAAAEHLTPVTLELGGKSPVLVSRYCDIKTTARRIAWGKWLNAGQTCIAPDYVLVDASVKEQLVAELLNAIQSFYGDEPQRSKDYGRIVNDRHFNRLLGLLDEHNVINHKDYDRRERFMAPMLVDDPPAHSALMQEEIFGPLLPICAVDNLDRAIAKIQNGSKPLACYAFTHDKNEQQRIEQHISCGTLCFNDTLVFMLNPELPFGGVGNSGMGRYHGEYGVQTFSHQKPVMTRRFMLDVALRYPPFNKQKLSWLKKLM